MPLSDIYKGLRVADVVRLLDLLPHPEGGYYRQTFRDVAGHDGRAASTAIYYLLGEGQISAWHRIDAVEVWHWYAGAPLALTVVDGQSDATAYRIGPDLAIGDRPQAVVPKGAWQTAESLGEWSLVGCTVAPGFEFSGFELLGDGNLPRP